MSEITSRIDSLLAKKGLTRYKMEKDLGLVDGTMRRWTRGSIPNAESLVKVAQYLHTSSEYLVTGESTEYVDKPLQFTVPTGPGSGRTIGMDEAYDYVHEEISRQNQILEIFKQLKPDEQRSVIKIARIIRDLQHTYKSLNKEIPRKTKGLSRLEIIEEPEVPDENKINEASEDVHSNVAKSEENNGKN